MNWHNYRSTQKGEALQLWKSLFRCALFFWINLAKLCSKEHFTKFSIGNNAFNNWICTNSLVSLVTQMGGIWDSRVLWMKPLCPTPTTVGRSHFTGQQKPISPLKSIFCVTESLYSGFLAIWRIQASYSTPEFSPLSPCYYLLPCHACCPRNLMSVLFSVHNHSSLLVCFCGSLHGDHLVRLFLLHLFLKGWQKRRESQSRVWFSVKNQNTTIVICLSWLIERKRRRNNLVWNRSK